MSKNKMNAATGQIYFNQSELESISMGLSRVMEEFSSIKKVYQEKGWKGDLEVIRLSERILSGVTSAASKIERFTGIKTKLTFTEEELSQSKIKISTNDTENNS